MCTIIWTVKLFKSVIIVKLNARFSRHLLLQSCNKFYKRCCLNEKVKAIEIVVDTALDSFAEGLISRYILELKSIKHILKQQNKDCKY